MAFAKGKTNKVSFSQHRARALEVLQDCLMLRPPQDQRAQSLQNALIVAVDFDGDWSRWRKGFADTANCQVGLAILDMKYNLAPNKLSHSPISTSNLVFGTSDYYARVNKRFCFGGARWVERELLCQKLEALVPRDRNIVLVGHNVNADLKFLRPLGFDLETSIYGILDTEWIATQLLPLEFENGGPSLCNLLKMLRIPFRGLHNSGNDAYFTLQALILLGIMARPLQLADEHGGRFESLLYIPHQFLHEHDPPPHSISTNLEEESAPKPRRSKRMKRQVRAWAQVFAEKASWKAQNEDLQDDALPPVDWLRLAMYGLEIL